MITFRAFAFLFLYVCFSLGATTHANSGRDALDEGELLRQARALRDFFTPDQFTRLRQARSDLERARDLIDYGERLQNTQPSRLNPDEDISGKIKQGNEAVAEGEAQIAASLQSISEILLEIKDAIETRTRLEIRRGEFDTVLADVSREALQQLWTRDYVRILYDQALVADDGEHLAPKALSQSYYDLLLELDGEKYSVFKAVNFEISEGGVPQFIFDSAPKSFQVQSAVLFLKITPNRERSQAILNVTAVDLLSWRIVASSTGLVTLDEAARQRLNLEPVPAEAAPGHSNTTPIHEAGSIAVRDDSFLILRLARLGSEFQATVTTAGIDDAFQATFLESMVESALTQGLPLFLSNEETLQAAYPSLPAENEFGYTNRTNGEITIRKEMDERTRRPRYVVSARRVDSDRDIDVGVVVVQ